MDKIQIIERAWLPEPYRFAVEQGSDVIGQAWTEGEARAMLAAYLKGPRVVLEVNPSAPSTP